MTRSESPWWRRLVGLLVAAGLVTLGAVVSWTIALAQHSHPQPQTQGESSAWLVKLGPDARAKAIERQLRGWETTMAEVSYRYTEMYWGGVDGNWDYAAHMAEELQKATELGLERRPEYRKSAETLFLKATLPQVGEAIKKKDPALFKQRIESLRASCTACHAAEKHAFIKIAVPTVRRNPLEKP
jgi:hypothetical protein